MLFPKLQNLQKHPLKRQLTVEQLRVVTEKKDPRPILKSKQCLLTNARQNTIHINKTPLLCMHVGRLVISWPLNNPVVSLLGALEEPNHR